MQSLTQSTSGSAALTKLPTDAALMVQRFGKPTLHGGHHVHTVDLPSEKHDNGRDVRAPALRAYFPRVLF
jgi:hypothetical protein